MECENFESEVVGLLYGELPEARRNEAEAHAASCEVCGKLSRELGEARKLAATLPKRIEPPRELDERIALAARAAAERRDVTRVAVRGGALHVAAAVILLVTLASSSFVLGARFGRPRNFALSDPPGEIHGGNVDVPIRRAPGNGVDINDPTPRKSPLADAPHEHDRDDHDRAVVLHDALLEVAKNTLKKDPKKALGLFETLVSNGESGRTSTLDAQLGRAEANFQLGIFDRAREDVASVRAEIAKNHPEPRNAKDVDALEDRANKLLDQINKP